MSLGKNKTLIYDLTVLRMLKIIVKGILYSVGGWIKISAVKKISK